jgi:lytic murein transglycosylase
LKTPASPNLDDSARKVSSDAARPQSVGIFGSNSGFQEIRSMSFAGVSRNHLRAALFAVAAAALLGSGIARAATCGDDADGFDDWLQAFKHEARSAGLTQAVIESALSDVSYDESVISHDRGQRAFHQSFEQFSHRMLVPFRLKRGRALLRRHADMFQAIEARYGVPGPVLVAIWGLETDFGAGLGKFPTFSALATLAYDCRRSDKFHAELLDALRLVQRGDLEPSGMRGAWAGEIGQTQFMPSSYLKYAVAFDGGGARDLINNSDDALASTANFLKGKGWRRGAGWDEGQPNFAALLEWNSARVYTKTIARFADVLADGGEADSEE